MVPIFTLPPTTWPVVFFSQTLTAWRPNTRSIPGSCGSCARTRRMLCFPTGAARWRPHCVRTFCKPPALGLRAQNCYDSFGARSRRTTATPNSRASSPALPASRWRMSKTSGTWLRSVVKRLERAGRCRGAACACRFCGANKNNARAPRASTARQHRHTTIDSRAASFCWRQWHPTSGQQWRARQRQGLQQAAAHHVARWAMSV